MATVTEALAIAIQHHQGGRLQAAEQIYRRILEVEPNQADALHLLGVIAHQTGKHEVAVEYIGRAIGVQGSAALFHNNLGEAYHALHRIPEAVACYRRALELKPDFAGSHNNLGTALKEQGQPDEAVACYRRAIELKPDHAGAHYNLGNALQEQGKLDEAVACYRRALQLKPDYAAAHNNLGNVLKEQGKLDEAIACFQRALQLQPDVAAVYGNLAVALKDRGKLDEAVACWRRALELQPDFAEAHSNLGNALREQGKLDAAVACYRRALELRPDHAETHSNLGVALKDQGRPDEALACYRRALELQPDFAVAHGNLGSDLEELGDLPGAEASFRTALRHDPRCAFAHYKLAELLGGKLPEQDLDAQRRLLDQGSASGGQGPLTDAERLLLHFGLAQVLDARGAYAEAAEHSIAANALRLAQWKIAGQEYDPATHSQFVDHVIAEFTPDFFAGVAGCGADAERPVFIVGLPRSGTTLLERILAGHSQVFAAGELLLARDGYAAAHESGKGPAVPHSGLDRDSIPPRARWHLEELRRRNATALRVVDKMPDNYLYLGFLAVLFPRARFIHCRRDLRDVAVSCWMTNLRTIHWASAPGHIAARLRDYRRIMDHWRAVLPTPLLEVSYEETVADLEGVARRLVAGCGLDWEPGCLEFHRGQRAVRTASTVQVRQPLYATSVGRWRHYEQSLAMLLMALDPDHS